MCVNSFFSLPLSPYPLSPGTIADCMFPAAPYSSPPCTLLAPSLHPPCTLLAPSSHPPCTLPATYSRLLFGRRGLRFTRKYECSLFVSPNALPRSLQSPPKSTLRRQNIPKDVPTSSQWTPRASQVPPSRLKVTPNRPQSDPK